MTTAKETPKETSAPKKAPLRTVSGAAAMMAKAKAVILKNTGQKPLQPSSTTMPHVSTGSFAVDYLIGGTPALDGKGPVCPGFPRRRISEVYGPESSGKTTLLLSAMVQAQKAGGTALFIDFEHSLDHAYAKKVGLSYEEDKLMVFQPNNMEEGLTMIYVGIASGIDIIGVDSVAGMVPKSEIEKAMDDPAKVGALAAKMANVLPKLVLWLAKHPMVGDGEVKKSNKDHPGTALVFLNQTRALIQTGGYGGHGDQENTTGGKALKFFAYVRLRTSRIKSEIVEKVDPFTGKKRRFPYGNLTEVKVVKSKVDAKQNHSCQMFIRYGFGIDDYFSIIESSVVQKLVKKEGAYYILDNERFQGKDKFRTFLVNNPKAFESLRTKLITAVMAGAIVAVSEDELSEEDRILESISGDDEDLDDEALSASLEAAEEVVEESAG